MYMYSKQKKYMKHRSRCFFSSSFHVVFIFSNIFRLVLYSEPRTIKV